MNKRSFGYTKSPSGIDALFVFVAHPEVEATNKRSDAMFAMKRWFVRAVELAKVNQARSVVASS